MAITQKELSRRLRAARKACHISQDRVARYMGVSRSTISRMEGGARPVSTAELEKLAYFYGRGTSDFLAEDFDPDSSLLAKFLRLISS